MRLAIFDVGNASCSIISSPNKIGMMIDCGSSFSKTNPVDTYERNKYWFNINPFVTSNGKSYELGLLHISHPDDDHVRNAKRVIDEIPPYLVHKRKYEEFPDGNSINADYIKLVDKRYRGSDPEIIDWGFDLNVNFQIPMKNLKSETTLANKIRNNSSIVRFIEYNSTKILYCGDMESEGWNWLIKNDSRFVQIIEKGVDILISSHHGHKSGYSSELFNIIGKVKCIIHSKASEGNIEGTDVSSQYSDKAHGIIYQNLNDKKMYFGKVLTTRSNGDVFIKVNDKNFNIWTSKASSNHEEI